jgi:hypothetical protein
MKKCLLLLLLVFVTTYSWTQINAITASSPKRRSDDHNIGIGLNYTWPSSGISCRIGINDKFKGQVSLAMRNYGIYSWSLLGLEMNYIFNATKLDFGDLEGFGYAGIGRGTISWKDPTYQSLGFENFHWTGFNIGVGAELFPDVLKNKVGIIGKLGFGSYGSYGAETIVATGLLYGGAIHYYIK